MFKHDQPVASDLTVAVGNAYRPINGMPLRIGTRDMLDTMAESEAAVHGDAEIINGDFRRSPEVCEEPRPSLAICISAGMLPRRHDVKNDKTLIWYVSLFQITKRHTS